MSNQGAGHSSNMHKISAALALNESRPIWYLERELAEVLMRTKLPKDFSTDDLHWRRRAMRIMLPKGILGFQRDGGPLQSLMFLDLFPETVPFEDPERGKEARRRDFGYCAVLRRSGRDPQALGQR